MEIRLLGPVEVRVDDRVVSLPRRQQRVLVAALALRAGEAVSTDRLMSDLWGEHPPPSSLGSLQNVVSSLRKALGRDVVVTQSPGYRLALPAERVDVNRFELLLDAARAGSAEDRAALLARALELWRGPALADIGDEEFARLAAIRLDELRATAREDQIDAELELGRHAALVAQLEALVTAHPLRERLRGQLMLALYRCGRQAEALEVYRTARLALADELGLDPSPELQELERRVLRQDRSLEPPADAAGAPAAPVGRTADRRLVTVLAALPPTHEDPERHRLLLDATLADVQQALARNGGTLERFGPEGAVAFFGAASPSDDDARRALAAAEELGLPAGIATGETVGGAGAVVTRAVELARSPGIALDERTQALVGETRRLDRPLVGRNDELGRLAAALRARGPTTISLVGEPGIGKTRLARELALRTGEGTTVLVARCVPYSEATAFVPLLGALRRARPERVLAGTDDAELVLNRLAALAGEHEPTSLGESFWAVRRFLEALAPTLLILDDIHWAGQALLDLVDYLSERANGSLLILCLARPELARTHGETIRLGPLDDEHARTLVPPELDDQTRDRIVGLAEGNPLYVEQLSAYAAEGGEGLPPTVEAVVAGRLGRLEDAELAVLERAAVVGREFSRGAVAALSDGPVDAPLSSLSRRGFIRPARAADPGDDGYRFHHLLLRDAAYARLTKADRADLHQRVAAWLDRHGPGDDAVAGYHLEQAAHDLRELGEDHQQLCAAAGERLGAAGMRAWRAADGPAAVSLLERAVGLLPATASRAELRWELAIALSNFAARGDESAAELARAAEEAARLGDERLLARAAAEQARNLLWSGATSLADAAAAMTASIETLERHGDHRGLGRALLNLASVHLFACNLGAVEDVAARAARHYEAAGMTAAACVGLLAESLYYGSTQVDEAEARCVALLERAADRQTEANVSAVLGALRAVRGATDDGRALIAHARALVEDLGHPLSMLAVLAPLEMDVEASAGNLEASVRTGRASFEALNDYQKSAYATTRAVQLADLLLDSGDPAAAEPFLDFAEANALEGDVLVQFLSRSMRARLLARAGAFAEAEQSARDGVEIAALTDALRDRARAHFALAEVLDLSGRTAEASRERQVAVALLDAKGAGALVPAAARAAARRRGGKPRRLPSRSTT